MRLRWHIYQWEWLFSATRKLLFYHFKDALNLEYVQKTLLNTFQSFREVKTNTTKLIV